MREETRRYLDLGPLKINDINYNKVDVYANIALYEHGYIVYIYSINELYARVREKDLIAIISNKGFGYSDKIMLVNNKYKRTFVKNSFDEIGIIALQKVNADIQLQKASLFMEEYEELINKYKVYEIGYKEIYYDEKNRRLTIEYGGD